MGVYIPPNSNSNSNSNTNANTNANDSGDNSLLKSFKFFRNPSIGLKLWGPLVPSADNFLGLKLLTGIQLLAGLTLFYRGRYYRKRNLMNFSIPNTWGNRFKKWGYAGCGTYLIFQSGLEMVRLSSPFDPWYEEVKIYNNVAIKNGQVPHWWFGPRNYKPMSLKEFVDNYEFFTNQLEHQQKIADNDKLDKIPQFQISVDKIPNQQINELIEIHQDIKLKNSEIFKQLLTGKLKDINELNRAQRIDDVLEGKIKLNPHYSKPSIQLGNYALTNDDEFEFIWEKFNPWDELRIETDYDIRLIPKWHHGEEEDINDEED